MTEAEIIQEVENDAWELRLTEQKIFQGFLKKKHKKTKQTLLTVVGTFIIFAALWFCLHCLPLMEHH